MEGLRQFSIFAALIIFLTTIGGEAASECNPMDKGLCIPVCCGPENFYKWNTTSNQYECIGLNSKPIPYLMEVYDSNATHIDTNSSVQNFSVYHQPMTCPKWRYLLSPATEISLGFIWNSSFILVEVAEKRISLVPPSNYCIEYMENFENGVTTGEFIGPIFSVCGEEKTSSSSLQGIIYFGLLILSTVCYFLSAGCYLFFLKVKDIHRRCFIAYSIVMGFSFLFLILLQQLVQGKCIILGFFFFYFIECGFLWLMILCLDLALELRYFDQASPETTWFVRRWWAYIALNVFPACFLIFSIIPDGIPDIPTSFIIYFGDDFGQTCFFNGTPNYFFFLPIGVMMTISLGALITAVYYMKINNKKHSNHFQWLDKRGSYKYIFRSCLLLWIFAAVWMIESAVRLKIPSVQYFALFVIEAALGIFAFLTFVTNRYVRKEMIQRLSEMFVKKQQTDILLGQL